MPVSSFTTLSFKLSYNSSTKTLTGNNTQLARGTGTFTMNFTIPVKSINISSIKSSVYGGSSTLYMSSDGNNWTSLKSVNWANGSGTKNDTFNSGDISSKKYKYLKIVTTAVSSDSNNLTWALDYITF